MFAYCENNPVNNIDPTGEFALSTLLLTFIVGAAINVMNSFIAATVTNQKFTWYDALLSGFVGGIGTLGDWGFLASSMISGFYTGITSYFNGASLGESIASGAITLFFSIPAVGVLSDFANGFAAKTVAMKVAEAIWSLISGTGFSSISAAITKAINQSYNTMIKLPTPKKIPKMVALS